MIYLLKFLIIYLLLWKAINTADDFNGEYDGGGDFDDLNDYRSVTVNRRQVKNVPQHFVGSNLFGSGTFAKKCFSVEDVALLSTRYKFEVLFNTTTSLNEPSQPLLVKKLLPNITMPTKLEDDKSVQVFMEYLYDLDEMLNIIEKEDLKYLSQQAFYDVVGGYLNYYYWPLVKYSYYSGMLTYNSTVNVYNLHKRSKEILNTLGNCWQQSIDFFQIGFKIEPINTKTSLNDDETVKIPDTYKEDACDCLLLISDEDYQDPIQAGLLVSLPQIDADTNDGILNLRLPFKQRQHFNLNAKRSAFVLLKYYVTVTKCYDFRRELPDRFDRRFQKLMKEKLLPFLQRKEFYPGFGAILRISETLNRRMVMSRNTDDTYADKFLRQSLTMDNQSHSRYEPPNDENPIQEMEPNNSTFLARVIHSISNLESGTGDEGKRMIILLLALVSIVVFLVILIVACFSIAMKSKNKNKRNGVNVVKPAKNGNCFKNLFKLFKKKPKNVSRSSIHDVDIGPRSSSILNGSDYGDTESRISSKASSLSLKDLIHAEINKRPTKASQQQINALSKPTKRLSLKKDSTSRS